MDALLREYKDKYGNVFAATIKDQQFIFRELTRKEYNRITEDTMGNDYGLEELICQTVTLHPEGYDFSGRGRAGVAKTLATQVLDVSGYTHPDQKVQMLNYYRNDMLTFDAQAETVIQLVFPSVTEEEMGDWTQEKLMKRVARAEWVMKTIWGMNFEFAKQSEEVDENMPQPEPPTLQEIGSQIREEGGDPMLVLKQDIVKKKDADYVQFPIIGGTKLLENEEVLNSVREQIQRLPER